MSIMGNTIGVVLKNPETIILRTDDGTEYAAAMTDEEVVLTADANDVRLGETVATQKGVITGEKEIPSYRTREGFRAVLSGSEMTIPFESNQCEFTKLQVIVCTFNTTLSDSVAATFVSIDGFVFPVNSADSIAQVSVDRTNQSIELNVINESDGPVILRYITYREEI